MSLVDRHAPIVKTIGLPDEEATQVLAVKLAASHALQHALIELHGNLGAGKTTFARYLLQALGVSGQIKSPTYAVLETYESSLHDFYIWHFDFYRFNDPYEWEDAGFRDIFASKGLKLVEWPEKAASLMPQADLLIHLNVHPDESRRARLTAQTDVGRKILQGVAD